MEKISKTIETMGIETSKEPGNCLWCGAVTAFKGVTCCDKCEKIEIERSKKTNAINNHRVLSSLSKIPYRFLDKQLDNMPESYEWQEEAKQMLLGKIKAFDYDRWRLPYLYGNKGSGKTTIATAAANTAMLKRGVSVYYVNVPMLLNNLNYYAEHQSEILAANMLILDDIGHHSINKRSSSVLFEMLNDRMNDKRGTLIISNFSIDELVEELLRSGLNRQTTGVIRDRILEMCDTMEVKGRNLRLEKVIEEG